MATKFVDGINERDYRFMKDVILKYHPDFMYEGDEVKNMFLHHAEESFYNMEMLIEQCIAKRAKELGCLWEHTNQDGMDYTDGSDCKTASLTLRTSSKNRYKGDISALGTKIGDLRCVIWNEQKDEVEFYFIPHKEWKWFANKGGTNITLDASRFDGRITRIAEYKVDSFDELCLAEATVKFEDDIVVDYISTQPSLVDFF